MNTLAITKTTEGSSSQFSKERGKTLAFAEFILELGKHENIQISPMKLNAILYFSHGWFLATKTKEASALLDEPIEAWDGGPMLRSIYDQYGEFGNDCITDIPKNQTTYQLKEEEQDHIKEVWTQHKEYSGVQLNDAMTQPGTPWDQTVNTHVVLFWENRVPEIDNTLIKEWFQNYSKENHQMDEVTQ